MAEENKQESAQEPVSASVPTPVFTEASAAQPTSAVDVDALVAKVVAAIEPTIEKKVQSVKDKRIDELQRRVGRADLEDLGVELTSEQEMKLRIRELESRLQPVQQSSQASGAKDSAQGNQFDLAGFAKEKGLDLNHAEALRIIQTPHRNPEHLKSDLLEWRLGQFTTAPDGSAAPAMASGAPPPDLPKTDAQIKAEIFGTPTDPFSQENVRAMGGGPVSYK